MSSLRRLLCFAISLPATLSWARDSVLVNGQEWLQPIDFTGYTYAEADLWIDGETYELGLR